MTNDNEITRSGRGRGQRGQALAELGMVITVLVFLVMGIVEFGRAMMIANMITQAARDGARAAVVIPRDDPAVGCAIGDFSAIQTRVLDQIATVTPSAGFTVTATQTCSGDIPLVQVQVTGTVSYIFGWLASGFDVSRTAAFRDEGCPVSVCS